MFGKGRGREHIIAERIEYRLAPTGRSGRSPRRVNSERRRCGIGRESSAALMTSETCQVRRSSWLFRALKLNILSCGRPTLRGNSTSDRGSWPGVTSDHRLGGGYVPGGTSVPLSWRAHTGRSLYGAYCSTMPLSRISRSLVGSRVAKKILAAIRALKLYICHEDTIGA